LHHTMYPRLGAMIVLSFVSMYVLMYAMVDSFGNVFNNVNQVYMAALMTAPMALIEISLMRSAYPDARLNALIGFASVALLIGSFLLVRGQVAVADHQFLRSMIPHHAGAVLMCREAPLERQDVKDLCKSIIASQEAEIRQMKAMIAGS
jgi:hypothetical protein